MSWIPSSSGGAGIVRAAEAELAKVDVRDVPSPATQKLQVESGDVDVALSLTPDLVDTLAGNPNVKVVLGQSLDNLYMGLTVDPALNPIRAKVDLGMRVLTYMELKEDTLGFGAYIAYQTQKEELARLVRQASLGSRPYRRLRKCAREPHR